MAKYAIYICGPSDCPHDPNFVHEMLFGTVCVPRDMPFTGRRAGISRTNKQTWVEVPELPAGGIWQWDGGCDAAGVTIPNRIDEEAHARARGVKPIVLDMGDGRAECPTCQRRITVKADGHLRRHRQYPSGPNCTGSDQPALVST